MGYCAPPPGLAIPIFFFFIKHLFGQLRTTQHNFNPTIFWGEESYILPLGLTLPVICLHKKIFDQKFFLTQKFFWPKIFSDPKFFLTQIFFLKLNFFDPNHFLNQKIFRTKKFFDQKSYFDPKFFWPNKFFWPKFFLPNNFLTQFFCKQTNIIFYKFFWPKFCTPFSTTKIV